MNKTPCNWQVQGDNEKRMQCAVCLTSADVGTTPLCPVAPVLEAEVSGEPLTASQAVTAAPKAVPDAATPSVTHTDNVVRLDDRKPVRPIGLVDGQIDEEGIASIEKLLDDMKAGRVVKVAFAAVLARDAEGLYGTRTGWFNGVVPAPYATIVAAVDHLSHRMHKSWDEA
jgi:hypothetical protein